MSARQFGRGLLAATLILALISVYWIVGRSFIVKNFQANVSAASDAGYSVQHRGLSLTGFPFRFRTHVSQPALTKTQLFDSTQIAPRPSGAVPLIGSIRGENIYYNAFSFRPLKWHFYHRGDAQFDMYSTTGERRLFNIRPFQIEGDAGLSFGGYLKSLSLEGAQLNFSPVVGIDPPITSLERLKISATPKGEIMNAQLRLSNLEIAPSTWPDLQPAFGPLIQSVDINIDALGLKSLDEKAFNRWMPDAAFRSENASIIWGDLNLNIAFDLQSKPANIGFRPTLLEGWIKISLEDHTAILTALYAAGLITYEQSQQFGLALNFAPRNAKGLREIALTVKQNQIQFLGQTLLRF